MKNPVKVFLCLVLVSGFVHSAFSRGDKIVPQVVAGMDDEGKRFATVFDLTNVSTLIPITNMRLAFYSNNGSPWVLQTSIGTGSSFTLSLQARQTVRVRTTGESALEMGYAVIHDEDPGYSFYSEDYVLGISAFYQVLTGAGATETVSVPVQEPTRVASIPIEIAAPNIYSALAIVNAADVANTIDISFYREDGSPYDSASFDLAAREQRSEFFDQELFPGLNTFKGMAEFVSTRPFVLLSLLQTRAADGKPQYTLLVPVDKESLRRNSYMILLQSGVDATPYMPLDVDGMVSDFYRNSDGVEGYSWDLEYWYNQPDTTSRFLKPINSAQIASLGILTDGQFDAFSMPQLKAVSSYSTNVVNMDNPIAGQTFAIRTGRGNYAKARIHRVIATTGADQRSYKDLVLEVIVYK